MKGHLEQIRLDSYKPLRELVFETSGRPSSKVSLLRERLMEIQLADDPASRTPVREAIRKLELEGFVVMIPRRNLWANLPSRILTMCEIRISLF